MFAAVISVAVMTTLQSEIEPAVQRIGLILQNFVDTEGARAPGDGADSGVGADPG